MARTQLISRLKMPIFEVKRRLSVSKTQALLRLNNRSLNQIQTVGGDLQCISQMCPWSRTFLDVAYAFSENKIPFLETGEKLPNASLLSGNYSWKYRDIRPKIALAKSGGNRNRKRRACLGAVRNGVDRMGIWNWHWWDLSRKWKIVESHR